MIKLMSFSTITGAWLVLVLAAPAHALVNQAWVSSHGTDAAGCGAPTKPCRSLQYVHDSIIAWGGEIDILDPADYGAVTITKPLSIVNDGVGTARVQQGMAGLNAININTSEPVHLRGLNIDGLGVAANGIVLNFLARSPRSLDIVNCVVRHFTGDGIRLEANIEGKFTIINTISSDNGGSGINVIQQPATFFGGTVTGAKLYNNLNGMTVSGSYAPMPITVVDTVAANNRNFGFQVGSSGQPASLTLRNVTVTNKLSANSVGIRADNGGVALLTHSVVTGNDAGVITLPGGQIYSYGDNNIDRNNADNYGSLTPIVMH